MNDPGFIAFRVLLLLLIGAAAYALGSNALHRVAVRRRWSAQTIFLLGATLRWTIVVLVGLVVLHQIGIQVSTVWTAISAVLVLVGIGFVAQWSVLSNALCAVFLVIDAPFRIGDEIELTEPSVVVDEKHGMRGRVVDISMIYTTLEQSDGGHHVKMPNNMFFQKAVIVRSGDHTSSLRQALFTPREPADPESGD